MTTPTPVDLMRVSMAYFRMMTEAQTVIGLRLLGMAGLWSVTPAETGRMMSEKGPAMARSMMAAGAAAMAGQRPDQIALAAVRPLGARTRANSRRLVKRGPKLP